MLLGKEDKQFTINFVFFLLRLKTSKTKVGKNHLFAFYLDIFANTVTPRHTGSLRNETIKPEGKNHTCASSPGTQVSLR